MQQNLLNLSNNSGSSDNGLRNKFKELESENKRLHDELTILQQEVLKSSQSINSNSTGLSRSDHIKYVNQIHEVYRKEIEKMQSEKCEVELKAKTSLEDLNNKLRSLETQVQVEKSAKVQALNEVTYKRIEMEKLQEDSLAKIKELRKTYEERICSLQKDIIDRDVQIETFNMKIGE